MSQFKFYLQRGREVKTLFIEITSPEPIEWRQVGSSIPLTESERSCIDDEAQTVIWEHADLLKPMFGNPMAELNQIISETFPK